MTTYECTLVVRGRGHLVAHLAAESAEKAMAAAKAAATEGRLDVRQIVVFDRGRGTELRFVPNEKQIEEAMHDA